MTLVGKEKKCHSAIVALTRSEGTNSFFFFSKSDWNDKLEDKREILFQFVLQTIWDFPHFIRRHDNQPNDIQPNDNQPNDNQPNDNQPNENQPNDNQPNDNQPNDTQH